MDDVLKKLERPPSAQHLLSHTGPTPEAVAAAVIAFLLVPPKDMYSVARKALASYLSNPRGEPAETHKFFVNQLAKHRNKFQAKYAISVLERLQEYLTACRPLWCRRIDTARYYIDAELSFPVNPTGLLKKADGSVVLVWVQVWKARTLSHLALRALMTILRHQVDELLGPEVGIEFVDLSSVHGGSTICRVTRDADVKLMSDEELAVLFSIYREGVALALTKLAADPTLRPKARKRKDMDPPQPDLGL